MRIDIMQNWSWIKKWQLGPLHFVTLKIKLKYCVYLQNCKNKLGHLLQICVHLGHGGFMGIPTGLCIHSHIILFIMGEHFAILIIINNFKNKNEHLYKSPYVYFIGNILVTP